MATKKQKRISTVKTKKKRKGIRLLILSIITLVFFGSLFFFFITLFDSLYPPVTGKAKKTYAPKEKWQATLYFSGVNERFLEPEKRWIPKEKELAGQVQEIVQALLDGSKTKLINTFPPKTALQDVKIVDGRRAYISFDVNLIRNHPGGSTSEMATIYSLTDTITANLPAIKEIVLLVDRKELKSIAGHIDTSHPFVANMDLLASRAKEG